jgi:hypothetical protein
VSNSLRAPNPLRAPGEMLEDIVLLCGKVFADHEEHERVLIDDLIELRDGINELRQTIGSGSGPGYKAVPKLVRPER